MRPTQLAEPGRRLSIGFVMSAIAALAVWLGVARFHPGSAIFTLFVGLQVVTFLVTRPTHRPEGRRPRPRATRRFRFTIWQIMAVVIFAAACSIMARSSLLAGLLAFGLFGMAALVVVSILRGTQRG